MLQIELNINISIEHILHFPIEIIECKNLKTELEYITKMAPKSIQTGDCYIVEQRTNAFSVELALIL